MSASVTRRAMGCLPRCWRKRDMRPRRARSRARSAGRAPWAMNPISSACSAALARPGRYAKNTYKPYPAGIVFHAVIDACFRLRDRIVEQIDQIEMVTVQGSALLLARGDRPVRNERDARVSIHHCVACGLLIGAAGVAEFERDTVVRPDIAKLAGKGAGGTRQFDAGRCGARQPAPGVGRDRYRNRDMSARQPCRPARRIATSKPSLRDGVRTGGSAWNAEQVIEAVWQIHACDDISGLMQRRAGRSGFEPSIKPKCSSNLKGRS